MEDESHMLKWSLLVELFNVLKSCIYIIWFFYSNHLTKQRKVKEMLKQMKIFAITSGVYVLFAICSLVMQIIWVNEFVKQEFFKFKF